MNIKMTKDTRQSILDTAEILILTRGYKGLSYHDIANVVGIRKASIHHHFPFYTNVKRRYDPFVL